MKKDRIAAQLYTVRDYCNDSHDLVETLQKVRALGFKAVQMSSLGPLPPHDLARVLEFMLLDRKDDWLAARLDDLDYGDIDGICKAARACPLTGVKVPNAHRFQSIYAPSTPPKMP